MSATVIGVDPHKRSHTAGGWHAGHVGIVLDSPLRWEYAAGAFVPRRMEWR